MKSNIETLSPNGPVSDQIDILIDDAAIPATQPPFHGHSHRSASHASPPPPATVAYLDPATVYTGSGPNRLPEAFKSAEYESLSLSILAAGGNIQPVIVRLLESGEKPAGTQYTYLLISGARRLHACRENALQVQALVREGWEGSEELIAKLVENHLRQALSPIELGRQLQFIWEQHADLSKRAVARLVGIDEAVVQKALDIAELPRAVIEASVLPATSATDIRSRSRMPTQRRRKQFCEPPKTCSPVTP